MQQQIVEYVVEVHDLPAVLPTVFDTILRMKAKQHL
jgi:hypothetical protein